jgi:hypothetical protein
MRRSSGWEGAGAMAAEEGEAKVVVGVELDRRISHFAYAHESAPTKVHHSHCYPRPEEEEFDLKTLSAIYHYRGGASRRWWFATRSEYERDLVGVKRLRAKRDVPELKEGVTVTQVIADHLRRVGAKIILQLSDRYGKTLTMENVQWCVTVPSSNCDDDDHAKKLMEVCMERAGLIRSPGGSPHPVRFEHALEAAARCCLREFPDLEVNCGDKLLVAHIGKETFDVAVQEVVAAGKAGYRMKAVAKRFGVSGGALNVDQQFNKLACAKIPCLEELLLEFPTICPLADLYRKSITKWGSRDMLFDGHWPDWVARRWEKFDKEHGNSPQISYNRLQLTNAEMEAVFKPLLDQIVPVIADQLLTTPNVKAIFIVSHSHCPFYYLPKIEEGLGCLHTAVFSPPVSDVTVSAGAMVMALDEVCSTHPIWADEMHVQTGLECNLKRVEYFVQHLASVQRCNRWRSQNLGFLSCFANFQ